MKPFRAWFVLSLWMAGTLCAAAQAGPRPAATEELFALANQSRAQAGAAPLRWDRALAEAAMRHCERMVQEGPIAHRYGGEPDLTQRAAATGSHFSLIEENIAMGSYAAQIHEGWLNSPGHRRNLLNPDVDRVGIAVIESRGEMYAVADYARGVQVMSAEQVEAQVARLLRTSGVQVRGDANDARAACVLETGFPRATGSAPAQYVMRWQGADLDHLPAPLLQQMVTGRYRGAAVGSCAPRGNQTAFTQYRVAVLLY
jgi:hypothetical protein